MWHFTPSFCVLVKETWEIVDGGIIPLSISTPGQPRATLGSDCGR